MPIPAPKLLLMLLAIPAMLSLTACQQLEEVAQEVNAEFEDDAASPSGDAGAPPGGSTTTTRGAVEEIAAPRSVEFNALENDDVFYVFQEQAGVTLADPLTVEITRPGTYRRRDALTPGQIARGRTVTSYYLQLDPVGTPRSVRREGSITFPDPVIGIQIKDASMNEGDRHLGAPGTQYATGDGLRSLELGADRIRLEPDGRTVYVNFDAGEYADQIRIITEAR